MKPWKRNDRKSTPFRSTPTSRRRPMISRSSGDPSIIDQAESIPLLLGRVSMPQARTRPPRRNSNSARGCAYHGTVRDRRENWLNLATGCVLTPFSGGRSAPRSTFRVSGRAVSFKKMLVAVTALPGPSLRCLYFTFLSTRGCLPIPREAPNLIFGVAPSYASLREGLRAYTRRPRRRDTTSLHRERGATALRSGVSNRGLIQFRACDGDRRLAD